jgi:hypothetical protein
VRELNRLPRDPLVRAFRELAQLRVEARLVAVPNRMGPPLVRRELAVPRQSTRLNSDTARGEDPRYSRRLVCGFQTTMREMASVDPTGG